MKVNTKQYAQALYEATEDLKGPELQSVLSRFVMMLAQKNVLSKVDTIIEDFKKYYNQRQGIAEATVTSAMPLSDHERKQVTDYLKTMTGKKIVVTEQVESSLIGGIMIEIDDRVMDSTIKTSLADLRNNLVRSDI